MPLRNGIRVGFFRVKELQADVDLLFNERASPTALVPNRDIGFALHGVTLHLFWTIKQNNLSPGLPTSVLYWIMAYFLARYGFIAGNINPSDFWIGVVLGVATVGLFLTFVPTLVIPRLLGRPPVAHDFGS